MVLILKANLDERDAGKRVKDTSLGTLCTYNVLSPFLKRIRPNEIFEFLTEIFIVFKMARHQSQDFTDGLI